MLCLPYNTTCSQRELEAVREAVLISSSDATKYAGMFWKEVGNTSWKSGPNMACLSECSIASCDHLTTNFLNNRIVLTIHRETTVHDCKVGKKKLSS